MSRPIIHVVRDLSTELRLPADGKDHRLVRYGIGLSGLAAGGAVLHDRPETADELDWVHGVLATRMVPGASIRDAWEEPPSITPSCNARLMDGRNEVRCWLSAGHEGEHK